MRRVLFAAGGTMGHIGPALTVARALRARDPRCEISFIGTRSGLENSIELGFPLLKILKVPLPRRIDLSLFLFPLKFAIAIAQSVRLVGRCDVVVGFGGYVATPVYIAAWLRRRRMIVHEANALPGFANRVGKRLGGLTFANFQSVASQFRCEAIGIPLREEIIKVAKMGPTEKDQSNVRRILVIGGSQGSSRINEAIWQALPELPKGLHILHAVGAQNLEQVPSDLVQGKDHRYQARGYIEEMAEAYRDADLVIARAGAVTCAELQVLGKRAILVPLGHGNGEQAENARELVRDGNAILVPDQEFDAAWLKANIERAFVLRGTVVETPRLEATDKLVEAILASGDRR